MAVTGSIAALPGAIDGFVIAPQLDGTPAAKTVAQQAERNRLAEINAGLSRRLATLRDGVAVLAERIKSEME